MSLSSARRSSQRGGRGVTEEGGGDEDEMKGELCELTE